MAGITDIFGSMVFSDAVMQERLPGDVYAAVQRTVKNGRRLQPDVAEAVAAVMRDWALEKGATHFTHWFQPMTGVTAEKHDSFIAPDGQGGVVMEFSGKELVHGEPDASSFPSGGLRATFEARGYTAWDPTSYAFIKDNSLYIPTAFCSYGGEALDKKTPLLRSMETLNRQALRVLHLFGNDEVQAVRPMVGAEQEYFLVERAMYARRKDLIYAGRTLFGAKPPKGQELDDHYFGTVKPRIAAFMSELNEELWRLGVMARTQHNEAAPAQHELACIYTTANLAADQNQLVMDTMQKVAKRHDLVCLLHEKPFEGVNGSGKHNNWSMSTDTGANLLEPGETPSQNARFLLFLCAVLKAVDEYQDMLRITTCGAGNDHRLGAAEAPPAIVSVYLGSELGGILESIEQGEVCDVREKELFKIGVHALPRFAKDATDRNRTSPFAFTGNKFEFRMLGSSASISGPNIVLNTAVAEELRQFADELEAASDFESALHSLIKRVIREHKRIIFNGNGYDSAWVSEAERRGLLNLPSTPECLPRFLLEKNVALFESHKVFSRAEVRSRYEIMLESYSKLTAIEAMTMVEMATKEILPAVSRYTGYMARAAESKRAFLPTADCGFEGELVARLSAGAGDAYHMVKELELALDSARRIREPEEQGLCYRNSVLPLMEALRSVCDELEQNTS
ncbi:MAG: glutamine synthetase III, partial [Oscillospiraceae bacterium]